MFGGGLFDLNRDGKMDVMERIPEFEFINRVMEDEEDEFIFIHLLKVRKMGQGWTK